MFAQKKTSHDIEYLEALVPRGLIGCDKNLLNAQVTHEGLCPIRIYIKEGLIKDIEVIGNEHENYLSLLLPRLVEPHAHIDKSFTWESSPNLYGSYEFALKANLEEHKNRTFHKVKARAEKALNLALKNGIRAIRSHVDSFGFVGEQSWEALQEIKKEWKDLIDLQLVALVPLEYWMTDQGKKLAVKVARQGGLLGGVIGTNYTKKSLRKFLINLFSLVDELGCGIDVHIDETDLNPGFGLTEFLHVLKERRPDVSITCSHLSSMGMLPENKLRILAERLADYEVNVVSLPLTNFWLLSQKDKISPSVRPLAPIKQLQNAGVTVAIGGDNVQDPWYPGGNYDPISLISASMPMTQLPPWERLGLSTFTTAASRLMGLDSDGMLRSGFPADFVVLDASSWSVAISSIPERKVMIKGNWI